MHNPQVPETLEGWSVLHQMFRINWEALRTLSTNDRQAAVNEAVACLAAMEQGAEGSTALVYLLGHKGDLMLVHFRKDFEALAAAELAINRLRLTERLLPTTSYVSVVELGMYEMTAKIHRDLAGRGLEPGTDAFEQAFDDEMGRQRDRVSGRLFPAIPPGRFVCFYPMNKRRGETQNWYSLPLERRAALMREHGMIGRHYAGRVVQVISGSIGYDDWEWGVDLFADDQLVFKKLIYEMRFDEASAAYAEFGPFYVGRRFGAANLPRLLDGVHPW